MTLGWRITETDSQGTLGSHPLKIFKKTMEIHVKYYCSCFLPCNIFFQSIAIWLHSLHLQNQNQKTCAELVVFQKVGRECVLHSDGINFPMWEKCQLLVTVSDAKQPDWFQEALWCLKRTPNKNLKTHLWPDAFKHFNVTSDKSLSSLMLCLVFHL